MKVPTKPDDTLIRGTFTVDCHDEEVEVAVLSDVPHLLKNSRNGLMKHKEWIVHPAHVRKYQLSDWILAALDSFFLLILMIVRRILMTEIPLCQLRPFC